MTKAEFVTEIASRLGITKKEAERTCEQVFDALIEATVHGDVSWPGFGKLESVERAARICRNPYTGEAIEVPAKKTVTFTPAKAFKERVQ